MNRVFFSPYQQMRFSVEEDTVSLKAFRYNIELEFQPIGNQINSQNTEDFLLAGCNPRFDALNVSNIQILNNSLFLGLPPSTDISYLFELADGTKLSRFRDFSGLENFISLRLVTPLSHPERLDSTLIIYFRDGTQWAFVSRTPILKN